MILRLLLTTSAFIHFIYGVAVQVMAPTMLKAFAIEANAATINMSRMSGAGALFMAMVNFAARDSGPSRLRTVILGGNVVYNLLATVWILADATHGGLSHALMHGALAAGFGHFLAKDLKQRSYRIQLPGQR